MVTRCRRPALSSMIASNADEDNTLLLKEGVLGLDHYQ